MLNKVQKAIGVSLKRGRREACEKVEDGAVVINGRVFRVIDWSAYGFSAGVCVELGANPGHIDCELTDRVDFKFSIHFRSPTKKRIEFVGSAIVIRIDKERQELTADFAILDEAGRIAIADHFADDSISGVGATTSPPEPTPAAPQQPEARLAEERRKAEEAREAEEARLAGERGKAEEDRKWSAASAKRSKEELMSTNEITTSGADSIDVGDELVNDRAEEIKRRAAEMAAEMAETEEDMHSVIFDLGIRNLAAFRKKVDAAGITQILQETPQIEVHDHDHAYGFRLDKMEYAVFADWDTGKLCRDVSLEGGTRQPRITDFDHDDALNEMVDCLARMLATVEAGERGYEEAGHGTARLGC